MGTRGANQIRILLELLGALRGSLRSDRNLGETIRKLLSRDRRFGSRDRRVYRELIYTALRYLPWIEPLLDSYPEEAAAAIVWLSGDLPALAALRGELNEGWPALPASLEERAAQLNATADLVPSWFREEAPEACEPSQLLALHTRAPVWLRIQNSTTEVVLASLAESGVSAIPGPVVANALKVVAETDVTRTSSFLHGDIEIQDIGSQLVLASASVKPGTRWLDACAGAGGKTLQLAALVGPDGHVDAYEPRPSARAELLTRLERSKLRNVTLLESPPLVKDFYDGVLVDAPCTGSGTWRRAPFLKYSTTPETVGEAAQVQRDLLDQYGALVRPGGDVIYATCSLNRSENQEVVAHFLAQVPAFKVVPADAKWRLSSSPLGGTILPAIHESDGFFVAHLVRD